MIHSSIPFETIKLTLFKSYGDQNVQQKNMTQGQYFN